MARAGFVFQPLPGNPDNVSCFLCNKALDGWEEDDRPLEEHLKHSPECGWAITAAIEAGVAEYAREDPRDELMMEARKATFANMWPHENRKGWACKQTQVSLRHAGFVSKDELTCGDSWPKRVGNTPLQQNRMIWPRACTASWLWMVGSAQISLGEHFGTS